MGQNSFGVDRSSPAQIGTGVDWSVEGLVSERACHHIKTDGTLWTWGENQGGTFGLNQPGPTRRSSPIQLPGSWSKITGERGEATQGGGVLAIKTNGTLWSWGLNEMGMLGLNQAHDSYLSSPTQVGTDTTWSEVRAGGSNICVAVKTDGTAWAWGHNGVGVLGQNDRTQRSSPTQIPGTSWDIPMEWNDAWNNVFVRKDV